MPEIQLKNLLSTDKSALTGVLPGCSVHIFLFAGDLGCGEREVTFPGLFLL